MPEKVMKTEPVEYSEQTGPEQSEPVDCSKTFLKWICCKSQEGAETSVPDVPPKAIGSEFFLFAVKVSHAYPFSKIKF